MTSKKLVPAAIVIALAAVAIAAIAYSQTQRSSTTQPSPAATLTPTPAGTSGMPGSPTETSTPSAVTPTPGQTQIQASPTAPPSGSSSPSSPSSSQPSPTSSTTPSQSTPTLTPQTTTPTPSSGVPTTQTPAATPGASATPAPLPSGTLTPGTSTYIVLAWNDLGMHCYNPDFKDICVLPPYNNLVAQVLRKSGENAQLVTSGVTVRYFFPDNTYSAGKTNFWDYANQTFNVALAPNVGLTGKSLSGTMDKSGTFYEAKGIPLTEYTDQNPTTRQPFQQAIVVVTDSTTGAELCRTQVVAPVSTEMRCDTCHSDTGMATTRYPITPTGKTDTNILTLHDYLHPTTPSRMNSRPVLCGSCHSDNALGTAGKAGIPSLSNAMHSNHNSPSIPIANTTSGCYSCHPGPQTQCLRDVMSQIQGYQCENCHGGLAQVAANPNPWLNEPRCDNPACHGSNATLGLVMNNALYRSSTGMGGVYCEGCHDSTHAIAPSRVAADDVKFVALQGSPSQLSTCTVCHARRPDDPFFHSSRGEGGDLALPPDVTPAVYAAILTVILVVAGVVVALRKMHATRPRFSSTE
ncbi:MAG: hypothetical protein ACE14S_10130 [Candidatus Bathyarchaeia archaeon]